MAVVAACLRALALAASLAAASGRRAARSPTWEEAAAEAREVSTLSDRIHATKVMISHWRSIHTKARDYHERQRELIQQQIEIRERQKASMQSQLEGYQAEQDARYKNKMCMLLLRAFHLGNENDEKVQVLRICNGLQQLSLAASTSTRHSSPEPRRISVALARAARIEGAWEGHLSSQLGRIVHSLAAVERRLERRCAASGACRGALRGPVQALEARLEELKGLLADVRAEHLSDKARWAEERAELSRVESDLGDEVSNMHEQKQAAMRVAAQRSTELFCPVVTANYGIDEESITTHIETECQ